MEHPRSPVATRGGTVDRLGAGAGVSSGRARMAQAVRIVLAVACAGLVSACGHGAGNPLTHTSRDSMMPSAPPGGIAISAPTLLDGREVRGLTSLPWRLTSVETSRPAIDIYYVAGGGCTSPRGIYVAEARTSVTIEAAGATDSSAHACAADFGTGYVRVPLTHPLGSRKLLHAEVDADWRNPRYLAGSR